MAHDCFLAAHTHTHTHTLNTTTNLQLASRLNHGMGQLVLMATANQEYPKKQPKQHQMLYRSRRSRTDLCSLQSTVYNMQYAEGSSSISATSMTLCPPTPLSVQPEFRLLVPVSVLV